MGDDRRHFPGDAKALQALDNLATEYLMALQAGGVATFTYPRLDLELITANPNNLDIIRNQPGLAKITRSQFDPASGRAFEHMLFIIDFVSDAIEDHEPYDLRDVYYAGTDFSTFCEKRVFEVGWLLGLKRFDMHIKPVSKGLVAGEIEFSFDGGNNYHHALPNSDDGGLPICHEWITCTDEDLVVRINPDIRTVVVVEKKGVHHKLCRQEFFSTEPCLLVTGSGFADVATKALLARLWQKYPYLDFVGVADYNPHGLSVLLNFRYPSLLSAYENCGFHVPLRWLGIRYNHLQLLPFAPDDEEEDDVANDDDNENHGEEGFNVFANPFKRFNDKDNSMLAGLRQRVMTYWKDLPEILFLDELDHMEQGQLKCELQVFFRHPFYPTFLADLIHGAIECGDAIPHKALL